MSAHKELLQVVSDLVAFNTVSHIDNPAEDQGTRQIADYIIDYSRLHGFAVNAFTYPARSGGAAEKVNLIITKGGDVPKLALSGHMDTVAVDQQKWQETKEAFCLTLKDGKYYGRGAADMKAFLAIAMVAGAQIKEAELSAPFGLYFTSDEEIGCIGVSELFGIGDVKEYSLIAPVPQYVVIGEPTKLTPINAHKGYLFISVKLGGKPGHSSDPDLGRSVVKLALPQVIQRLNRLEEKLRYITDPEGRFTPNFPTLNQGVVDTGKDAAKNKIAAGCEILLEIRLVPGQDVDETFRVVKMAVESVVSGIDGITADVSLKRRSTPPMLTASSSLVVQIARSLSGKEPEAVNFNTEGGIFNSCGAQTVIWGPGSIKQAHTDDEYIEEKYLEEDTVNGYINLIKQVCC
jgi:acetylornithine deacetylase